MTSSVSRIGDYIREQRESSRLSLRRLAEESGISNPYLSQIERGLRKPSAEILQQIAKALRISAEQLYVQAGLLEDRGSSLAVETAVLGDPLLNERQKRVLLDIYASFLAETVAADEPSPRRAVSPPTTPKPTTPKPTTPARPTKGRATPKPTTPARPTKGRATPKPTTPKRTAQKGAVARTSATN